MWTVWVYLGGVFAQRTHSAGTLQAHRARSTNYHAAFPGSTPKNHPSTKACMITSKQPEVQDSGPWDLWLLVVENSRLFAQRTHSVRDAPLCDSRASIQPEHHTPIASHARHSPPCGLRGPPMHPAPRRTCRGPQHLGHCAPPAKHPHGNRPPPQVLPPPPCNMRRPEECRDQPQESAGHRRGNGTFEGGFKGITGARQDWRDGGGGL